ncbi:MAG: dihydrolipoyl dehydrogenase [Spirochaetales bacterium]|nr:dihydrolipoyl dehydrogenase [Spirochaetales bacterium]
MASYDYDLLVLGAGPGGYVAAIRAAQLGLKTAVVEKDKPGGVCLNIGCIPSKAIIHSAELVRSAKELEGLGAKVELGGLEYGKVFAASRKAADTLSRGVGFLLKKNNVELIAGEGVLAGAHEVQVKGGSGGGAGGGKKVTAKSILIATGSRPRPLPGFDFDEKLVLSSTGALMLQELPKRVCVLGGGAIGVEFAHIMNAFGVEVHLVEMLDHLLPLEDAEVAEVLTRSFKKRGITIYTSTKASSYSKSDKALKVSLEGPEGAKEIEVDQILLVVGRLPNTEGIGLEGLGITADKGFVPVGDYYQTSVPGVFAVGDVIRSPMLAHVASAEGELVAEYLGGHEPPARLDPGAMPGGVYCEPQVASFGVTEAQAVEQKLDFQKAVFPYRGAGKSVAIGRTEGMVKILVDKETREILGAHVVGAEATELIHELLLAKTAELLPEDLATMIHAHPTLSEAVMEAARAAEGWAIHV